MVIFLIHLGRGMALGFVAVMTFYILTNRAKF